MMPSDASPQYLVINSTFFLYLLNCKETETSISEKLKMNPTDIDRKRILVARNLVVTNIG